MKKRIFGIETEYGLLVKENNGGDFRLDGRSTDGDRHATWRHVDLQHSHDDVAGGDR